MDAKVSLQEEGKVLYPFSSMDASIFLVAVRLSVMAGSWFIVLTWPKPWR